MSTAALDVWWGTDLVGTLDRTRRGIRFRYASPDAPMISVTMPPRRETYTDRVARPFFHGLLPEGEARRIIAYDLGLGSDGGDDLDLLAAIGKDCAGALVIISTGADPTSGSGGYEPLTRQEVSDRLRDVRLNPLGVDQRVRLSLPGVQPKLLLGRAAYGDWLLPIDGAPSTHILKPAHSLLAGALANELFCQRLLANAGCEAADTTIESFEGRPALVSTRYDRRSEPGGGVVRLHQEDACQAESVLTVLPTRKYQQDRAGLPSLQALAMVLDQWGQRPLERETLLARVTLNMLIGNADLHGKNLSILHEGGEVRLAPAYDTMSTTALSANVSTALGLFVGDSTDINAVSAQELVDEGIKWGLRSMDARRTVADTIDRLASAIQATADELPQTPPSLVEYLTARASEPRFRLGSG